MSEIFDVIVIGGGPAGYVASIKCAQLGLKTACIAEGELGGTCLNVGCIPSKTLLHSSAEYYNAIHNFKKHGIVCKDISLDLNATMQHKASVITSLNKGIAGLFTKNKVTYIKGKASFKNKNQLTVAASDGNIATVEGKNIIIATGSKIATIPSIEIDEEVIVSSTGALNLKAVPKSMLIIGAGYIGLEMASVWSRFGAKVDVAEFGPKICPNMDTDIANEFYKILQNQGINFMLSHKVISAKRKGKVASTKVENMSTNTTIDKEYDIVLVCIGRLPYTEGLNLEELGITLEQRGTIKVNQNYQVINNIYAIGDVIKGPMLAHKAEEEAVAVAEIIAGQHPHINYGAIPSVIYTNPEIASVGATEEQLKNNNTEYKVGKFPFLANSRARANSATDGFVKILSCKKTDEILGAHIIGQNAGELIQEIVLAMEFRASAEDIARTSHGHPGLAEAVKEASMAAAFGKPLHM